MASSLVATTSRPTPPFVPPSRVAEAVQIAPYLTHVVRHHGQITLIPPENAGKTRKSRKKKQRSIREEGSGADNMPFGSTVLSTNGRLRPTSPISMRSAPKAASSRTRLAEMENDDVPVPDIPPPSFEEAISSTHPSRQGTRDITHTSDCNITSVPISIEPPDPIDADDELEQDDSLSKSSGPPVARTQWEEETNLGVDLQERVRREFQRKVDEEERGHHKSDIRTDAVMSRTPESFVGGFHFGSIPLPLSSSCSDGPPVRLRLAVVNPDPSTADTPDPSPCRDTAHLAVHCTDDRRLSPGWDPKHARGQNVTTEPPSCRDTVSSPRLKAERSSRHGHEYAPQPQLLTALPPRPKLTSTRPLGPRLPSLTSCPSTSLEAHSQSTMEIQSLSAPFHQSVPSTDKGKQREEPFPRLDQEDDTPEPWVMINLTTASRPSELSRPLSSAEFPASVDAARDSGASTTPSSRRSSQLSWLTSRTSSSNESQTRQRRISATTRTDKAQVESSARSPTSPRSQNRRSRLLEFFHAPIRSTEATTSSSPEERPMPRSSESSSSEVLNHSDINPRNSSHSNSSSPPPHTSSDTSNTTSNAPTSSSASASRSSSSSPRRPESFLTSSFARLRPRLSPTSTSQQSSDGALQGSNRTTSSTNIASQSARHTQLSNSSQIWDFSPLPIPSLITDTHMPSISLHSENVSRAQVATPDAVRNRVAQFESMSSRPIPPPPPRGPAVKRPAPPIPPVRKGDVGGSTSESAYSPAPSRPVGTELAPTRTIRRKPPPPPPPPEEIEASTRANPPPVSPCGGKQNSQDEWIMLSPTNARENGANQVAAEECDSPRNLVEALMDILDTPLASGEVEEVECAHTHSPASQADSSTSSETSFSPDTISITSDGDVDLCASPVQPIPPCETNQNEAQVDNARAASARRRPLPAIPARPPHPVGTHLLMPQVLANGFHPMGGLNPGLVSKSLGRVPVVDLDPDDDNVGFPVPSVGVSQSSSQPMVASPPMEPQGRDEGVSVSPAEREVQLFSPWENWTTGRGGDRASGVPSSPAEESSSRPGPFTRPSLPNQHDPRSGSNIVASSSSSAMPSLPPLLPLQPMFTGYTDLDILLHRVESNSNQPNGASYDDLLTLSEIIGPGREVAKPLSHSIMDDIPVGKVEIQRRRVMKDGRSRVKLSLLGVVVDKCGVCLSQFKLDDWACLVPCQHAFHERCLRSWFVRSSTCPLCRFSLQVQS